jgi:dethiobiotin synthase
LRRIYIAGTDTDVGKTRVTAAVAKALRASGEPTTVVKIVQTGLPSGVPGDAHTAGALAGCPAIELHRFEKPADPWTAARAAGAQTLRANDLAEEIRRLPGSLVVEGSGGVAVPLNADETISDVAAQCALETILVVGLRLGCINHALLSLGYLRGRGISILGAVLCERWTGADAEYHEEVRRVLRDRCSILDTIFFEDDATKSIEVSSRAIFAAGTRSP